MGLASPGWWPASTLPAQRYATARGERRRVDLEDGSVLTLNTGTQTEVRYTRSERRVTLHPGGEIMLDVSPDASHPFIVDTEIGRCA
ncbi:FecR domain-containing protein [Achromobacter xylosoxidans]